MNINIPEPCDADWNKMKIGVRSRFCDLCTKHVVDFTKISKTEILEYFINKDKSERTCGHFNQNQLDFSIADLELIIETAKKNKTQGQALVKIILDDKGKIIESHIIRGLSPEINDEVIRVIYLMPNWIPGKNKGENVKSQMTIPIRFSL